MNLETVSLNIFNGENVRCSGHPGSRNIKYHRTPPGHFTTIGGQGFTFQLLSTTKRFMQEQTAIILV